MAPATLSSRGVALVAAVVLMLVAAPVVHGDITIRNQCPFTVTAFWRNQNNPTQNAALPNGGTQNVVTDTSWPAGVIWGSQAGNANNSQANQAEFTIGGGGGQDTYDISNVNAYDIAMLINPATLANGAERSGQTCGTINCSIPDIQAFCQPPNVLTTDNGPFCTNTDGPGQAATPGTMQFKNACASSYSFSTDDPTSTFTCPTGSTYEVVFCP